MFIEKAATLSYHPAFVASRIEVFLDVVDVPDDIILVDGLGILVIVVGKDVTHLGGVIPNRTR